MRKQTYQFFGLLAFILLLVPILVQPYYNVGTMTVYRDTHVDLVTEVDSSSFYYWNTTGSYLSYAPVETLPANDTWTMPLVAVAQDLTQSAYLYAKIEADTLFNVTAFDQDTTGHIISFDYRIQVDDDVGELLKLSIGIKNKDNLFIDQVTYVTSESLSRYTLTTADYDEIDDATSLLAGQYFLLTIYELDAQHLVTGATVTVEIIFYEESSYLVFDQVLLLVGIAFFVIGLVMTNAIDIQVSRRSKRYRSWRFRQHLRGQAYRYRWRSRRRFRYRRRR